MEKEIIQMQLTEFEPGYSLTIISKGRVISIPVAEITHVRKFGYETIIYTREREYKMKYSLQDIQNDLPAEEFFRVHRSHIVSLMSISSIRNNKAKVGETYLQITGYYKEQMITELSKRLNQLIEFHHRTQSCKYESCI